MFEPELVETLSFAISSKDSTVVFTAVAPLTAGYANLSHKTQKLHHRTYCNTGRAVGAAMGTNAVNYTRALPLFPGRAKCQKLRECAHNAAQCCYLWPYSLRDEPSAQRIS